MKNKIFKSLFLGISITAIATASYALIAPLDKEIDAPVSLDSALQTVVASPQINPPERRTVSSNEVLYYRVKKGDTLSTIFEKLNLSQSDLYRVINAPLGKQFAALSVNKELVVVVNEEGLLQQLSYQKNSIKTLQAIRIDNTFDVNIINKKVETKIASRQVTIQSSLSIDGQKAGLSNKLMMQLASIFAWDIDFALDLRKGDEFTIVYEKKMVNEKMIRSGNILSAEFINRGQVYRAVQFVDKQGVTNYFTPEGKGMRKAFLRSPVDFARISSKFNLKRKHPVLNKIRAHKGVDYAARTGTPIKTTGDGKIIYRGVKGGYGRVVIVQHANKYSTLYAHMSNYKKGQKRGSYVKQGQVIGYVGKSGLATGAHLHYEFRVNNVHKNPLTIKLPHSNPIKKSLLASFKKQIAPHLAKLNKATSANLLAQK